MNRDSINVTLINILFSETINRISIQVKHDYQHCYVKLDTIVIFKSNIKTNPSAPHLMVFGVDQFSEHI